MSELYIDKAKFWSRFIGLSHESMDHLTVAVANRGRSRQTSPQRPRHRQRRHSDNFGHKPPWFLNGPWTLPTPEQIHGLYKKFTKLYIFGMRQNLLPAPLRDQLNHYLLFANFCHRFSYFHPAMQATIGTDVPIKIRRRTECLTFLTYWLVYEHPEGMRINYHQLDQREKHITLPFLGPGCSVHDLETLWEYIEQEAIIGRNAPSTPRPHRSPRPNIIVTTNEDGTVVSETVAGLFPRGLHLDEHDSDLVTISNEEREAFQRWLYTPEADLPWNAEPHSDDEDDRAAQISPLDITEVEQYAGLRTPNLLSRFYREYITILKANDPNHVNYNPAFFDRYSLSLSRELTNIERVVSRNTVGGFRMSMIEENAAKIFDVPNDYALPDHMHPSTLAQFLSRREKEIDTIFPKLWIDYLTARERDSVHRQMWTWMQGARERHASYETLDVPLFVGMENSPISLLDHADYALFDETSGNTSEVSELEEEGLVRNECYRDEVLFADEDQPPQV